MLRMEEGFCFPASHLVSLFVLEKQDFKKVMLILAMFSWRKGKMCFFFCCFFSFLRKDADNQSRPLTVYVDAQGSTVRSEWQGHATPAYAALFSHWMKHRDVVFFWCAPWRKKCQYSFVRFASFSVRYVHSEIWKFPFKRGESQIWHRIFLERRDGFPAFWCAVSSSSVKHTYTHPNR